MFSALDHSFFKAFTPTCLPVSALTTCPRFDNLARSGDRRPLAAIDDNLDVTTANINLDRQYISDDCWLTSLFEKVPFFFVLLIALVV